MITANGADSMPEFSNCPCSGGTLDKLVQPAILAVLSESPSHGYRIAERIAEMPNFVGEKPDVSGIYRFLKKMEATGLVTSSWETGGQGHAKRLYENNGRWQSLSGPLDHDPGSLSGDDHGSLEGSKSGDGPQTETPQGSCEVSTTPMLG